ncbi:MAG: DnaJ domain [Actinomycetota bacterium]
MVDDSYYQLLGVNRSSSLEEIVSARRLLAREFHPDRGGDPQYMALSFQSRSKFGNESS